MTASERVAEKCADSLIAECADGTRMPTRARIVEMFCGLAVKLREVAELEEIAESDPYYSTPEMDELLGDGSED
jgi:hypothetical protein